MTKLKLAPKLTLVFASFAAAILIGVALIVYYQWQTSLKAATINELETIAGIKAAAVTDLVTEKETHISVLSAAPSTIQGVSALIATAPASYARQLVQEQLVAEFKPWVLSDEFLDLFLLEPGAGKVMLGVQPG